MDEISHHEDCSSKNIQNTLVKAIRRKTVCITLPRTIVEQARKPRLNISKISEEALTGIIAHLEASNSRNSGFSLSPGSLFVKEKGEWCSGRDSNPGLRLERPEYLTGLYSAEFIFYRSPSWSIIQIHGSLE